MSRSTPPRENLFINLLCNLAIPTLVLMKLSSDKWLGPVLGLVVALAFPLGYGIYDFWRRRQANIFSIVGFVSVLLSGGLGLLQIEGFWFAVKEASVPLVLGLAVLLSTRTRRPLVRTLLLNDQVINVPRVEEALQQRNARAEFEGLLVRASYGVAASFLLSATLNFGLARYLLRDAPGTPEFNAALGRMQLLSFPVIVVPSMVAMTVVLWWLVKRLEKLTGLDFDHLFHGSETKPPADAK